MSSNLSDYQRAVDEKLSDYRTAKKTLENERNELTKCADKVATAEEAQKIAQIVAQTVQQQAHDRIASIVSRCLATVFEEPYVFKILFEQKRGRTEARLVFEKEGNEVDPLTASGGGVVDLAAFALRLSCLMLAKPPVRRVLVADEPFRFVSVQYREKVAQLLKELSSELKIQMIFVTHQDEMKMGKVIELT